VGAGPGTGSGTCSGTRFDTTCPGTCCETCSGTSGFCSHNASRVAGIEPNSIEPDSIKPKREAARHILRIANLPLKRVATLIVSYRGIVLRGIENARKKNPECLYLSLLNRSGVQEQAEGVGEEAVTAQAVGKEAVLELLDAVLTLARDRYRKRRPGRHGRRSW